MWEKEKMLVIYVLSLYEWYTTNLHLEISFRYIADKKNDDHFITKWKQTYFFESTKFNSLNMFKTLSSIYTHFNTLKKKL